jgi:hypothetical protein
MEIDIGLVYGYLLIVLGAVIAIYSQLKSISSSLSETKDGISSIKWSQYAWFSFFSLTLIGTLVHLFNSFQMVNFRTWVWNFNDTYFENISNGFTITLDVLFIFICFFSLLTTIRKVGSIRGGFSVSPDNRWELILVLIGHPAFTWSFLILSLIFGVSYVLIGLYFCIMPPLFSYIIKYGKTN